MSKKKVKSVNSLTNSDVNWSYVNIPFEEWNDSQVEAVVWDERSKKSEPDIKIEETLYDEHHMVHLPPSIPLAAWKRPKILFPGKELVIYAESGRCIDLITPNEHLLQSEFMRNFIFAVETLCYLGNTGQYNVEYTNPKFIQTSDNNWRPWYHIYSNCKVGKGAKHFPTYNSYSKYIVRLWWLGSWRQIFIDDLLPVNSENQIMLPTLLVTDQQDIIPTLKTSMPKQKTLSKRSKEKSIQNLDLIELWPFLLCKALLKLASLTWYHDQELVDFDILQALTGWIPNKIYTRNCSFDEIWKKCQEHTNQYVWPIETEKKEIKKQKKNKEKSEATEVNIEKDKCDSFLAICIQKSENETENTFSLPWNHSIFIDKTRDIPLTKPAKATDFPLWKRYRWLEWAASEGLIPPTEPTEPIKSLKVVDPFKSIFLQYEEILTKDKQPVISKRSSRFLNEEISHIESQEGKKIKSFGSFASKSFKLAENIEDPTFWIDYDKICAQFKYLVVYYKPSSFTVKIRVSDFASASFTKTDKYPDYEFASDSLQPHWVETLTSPKLKQQRNEPLYIFTDSLQENNIIFNFMQTGFYNILKKTKSIAHQPCIPKEKESECGLCIQTYLARYKSKGLEDEQTQELPLQDFCFVPNHYRPKADLLLGKFQWCTDREDEFACSITTYGAKGFKLSLKPGRHVFRLWLKSRNHYTLQIFSNQALVVGELDLVLKLMEEESYLVAQKCQYVAECFDKVVKSIGKADFINNFQLFYKSYKPQVELTKAESNLIHETFYQALSDTVCSHLGKREQNSLMILFRQWQFPYRSMRFVGNLELCYYLENSDEEFIQILQNAACKIQALFKGNYERNMLKKLNHNLKKNTNLVETANSINRQIFDKKGPYLLPSVFRNVLRNVLSDEVAKKYEFYEDLNSVVARETVTQLFKPVIGWVLICRQSFLITSVKPITLRIILQCDLTQYYLRVFNNATREEVKCYINSVAVSTYKINNRGYTAFGYGWASESIGGNYRIIFVTDKIDAKHLSLMSVGQIKTETVSGNYIPNSLNQICKYFIHIKHDLVLTIRLTTNSSNVKVRSKIIDSEDNVIQDCTGHGGMVIPITVLYANTNSLKSDTSISNINTEIKKSFSRKSKTTIKNRQLSLEKKTEMKFEPPYTTFIFEAFVIDDSWPLTASEWQTVKKEKQKMLYFNGKLSKSKTFISSLESPLWGLQFITNSEDAIQILKDTSREDEVKTLKNSWYEHDPERYNKSQRLRNIYLEKNFITNSNVITDPMHRDTSATVFEKQILPPFDMSQYATVINKDKTEKILKTPKDLEFDNESELKKIKDFEILRAELKKNNEEYILKQIESFNTLNTWYNMCRQETKEMLDEGRKQVDKYVMNISKPQQEQKDKPKKEGVKSLDKDSKKSKSGTKKTSKSKAK